MSTPKWPCVWCGGQGAHAADCQVVVRMTDKIFPQQSELDRLRLENARLAARLEGIKQHAKYADAISYSAMNKIKVILDQSPSTALAEFLGPTMAMLKYLETSFNPCTTNDIRKEIDRLTSAIGGDV